MIRYGVWVIYLVMLSTVKFKGTSARYNELDGCWHVFIDAGANIGIHSRFLFEPEKFPNSKFSLIFDEYFGRDRDASTTCAVSF